MNENDHINDSAIKIGRFAPSPTGPLHFGSLIAAVASYLCARQNPESKWLLRIEDVDTLRERKGASKQIIEKLEAYGFEWDGNITYQSQRTHYYQDALHSLKAHTYPCSCSRKELRSLQTSTEADEHNRYPGFCRHQLQNPSSEGVAIRLITSSDKICFTDDCQPETFCQNIEKKIGDFIIKRRDGLFAYQLAVVVDDHLQDVNHIVRGADLFDNTPRQIYLQKLLGYNRPTYLHFPVANSPDDKKLSKQNHTPAITNENKLTVLINALLFLGQSPPSRNNFSNTDDLWHWAFQNWDQNKIPKVASIIQAATG